MSETKFLPFALDSWLFAGICVGYISLHGYYIFGRSPGPRKRPQERYWSPLKSTSHRILITGK